ncbi:SAM-dependent methyltransferase [Actinocatenispora sera]|uniref:S-adenosyl methyltransferase n=1 Tax=Actinocatenispora sera TaxID=390989 RepID=A0A810KXB9_9ACTN|nr:SAM-dependent methyltransferase [Actinocatenispora sera]BCJ26708.1 hypothetical protein Asera_08160 [Actinocatenispora sera]
MEQPEPGPGLDSADLDRPSPARIYDYLLGGAHNFASDRSAGERAAATMPTLVPAIRANRGFLRRVVVRLAGQHGITQFLDLGSGIPTVGNVHEIAQNQNRDSRVLYVDIDPVAVAHARHILSDTPLAETIQCDFRDPESVLGHPTLTRLLDLDRPVAVLMNAVLHFVPDEQNPGGIVGGYLEHLVPGSYLAISHAAPDPDHPREQEAMVADYRRTTGAEFINRSAETIAGWLHGLDIEPPGIVPVNEWHPDRTAEPILRTYGVLARKP